MSKISCTTYEVDSPIKIAFVSDTHEMNNKELLPLIRSISPDIIAICGDFVYAVDCYSKEAYKVDLESRLEHSPNAVELLTECPKIAPTFASFGNHEWMLTNKDIDIIRKTGSVLLDNTYMEIVSGVFIGGLTSEWLTTVRRIESARIEPCNYREYEKDSRRTIIEQAEDVYAWMDEYEKINGYKILLSHHPQHWELLSPKLIERRFDLVLTGHAHGGQIRYYNPFKKRWQGIISPDEGWLPKYTEGIFKGPYGHMVISRGLANTYGIPRFFNPPEIVIIE